MAFPTYHPNPYVHAITMILHDWFLAMQDGTASWRTPDPLKPVWTEDRVDRLIQGLDAYYDKQVAGWAGAATGSVQAKAGPDFWRLSPQALAIPMIHKA